MVKISPTDEFPDSSWDGRVEVNTGKEVGDLLSISYNENWEYVVDENWWTEREKYLQELLAPEEFWIYVDLYDMIAMNLESDEEIDYSEFTDDEMKKLESIIEEDELLYGDWEECLDFATAHADILGDEKKRCELFFVCTLVLQEKFPKLISIEYDENTGLIDFAGL